jgi:hypothetical protein
MGGANLSSTRACREDYAQIDAGAPVRMRAKSVNVENLERRST